jgi:hypothetical protein
MAYRPTGRLCRWARRPGWPRAGVQTGKALLGAVGGRLADQLAEVAPAGRANLDLVGSGYWIEPVISEHAIEGYDEKLRPVLAQKPLGQAETISAGL